jgi:membrane protein YdbS with pleckstrin-like domain
MRPAFDARHAGGMSGTAVDGARSPIALRPPKHRVERRAIGWWLLQWLVFGVFVIGGLVVAYVLAEPARFWLLLAIAVLVPLGVALALVEAFWRYAVHRWETTDEAVYAMSGWFVREWRIAPISRIQTVDTVRGPLQQWLGLATLRITTASAQGAIEIGGLDERVAAEAARRLTEITQRTPGDAT